MECAFDFLKKFGQYHPAAIRDHGVKARKRQVLLDDSWQIAYCESDHPAAFKVVLDIQNYLLVSQNLSLRVYAQTGFSPRPRTLWVGTEACFPEVKPARSRGAFVFDVQADRIILSGRDDRGLWRGMSYLEDMANFAQAPLFDIKSVQCESRLRMRAGHSGSGIDDFNDTQLMAMLHAGFTAIEVFVKDFDRTSRDGYCNISELIERADAVGLDTILYNYMHPFKHPDDDDAVACFDAVYGELFRRYPKAHGILLCGETLEFPSKDPATTGKRFYQGIVDSIPDTRPSPGWWPCSDYPRCLQRIVDAITAVKPDAEIIFNTYNFGYVDAGLREKFLRAIPKNITIQATYEMFKQHREAGLVFAVMDYTLSHNEPGDYFLNECAMASAAGLKLRATTNTSGSSWDFGTVPFVPAPYQMKKRFAILNDMRERYGLDSHYENHHYGWMPNVIVDMARWNARSCFDGDMDKLIAKVAVRDYGKAAAPAVLAAWRSWSNAMKFYVPSNEDQYGPWRVGPAYPMIFHPNITRIFARKEISYPFAEHATHGGDGIVKTLYQPIDNLDQSPGVLRYRVEIPKLKRMLRIWQEGQKAVTEAAATSPAAQELQALGLFIENSITTTIHVKEWWQLNVRLQACASRAAMLKILDRIEVIAHAEIDNARATIPAVETNSRLGWEPTMEYVVDRWHLEWKVRQVESALREIASYRKVIALK